MPELRGVDTVRILPSCPMPDSSEQTILAESLAHPIGSPRLRTLALGARSAVILVPGRDRVAAADRFMPLLLDELSAAGIPDSAIRVVLATGTHAVHTADDAAAILGSDVCRRVSWRQHNCSPGPHLVSLGTTSRGTPVLLDRETAEAGVVVLTGRIIPHYFAGFGGGRKAILPGVSGRESILRNHRLTLDPHRGIHPAVRPANLAGNPVHEDMLEAVRHLPRAFLFNTLLDEEHRVVAAVAGESEAAHAEGCRLAERWFTGSVPDPFDAVISCAGGWPYDCDYVQALKTIFNVRRILRKGGCLLWIAECEQGIRDGFLRWARFADDTVMERAIRDDYDLAGHNTILLRALTRQADVALWSSLSEAHARTLGLTPVRSLAEGISWLQDRLPPGSRCAVVPHANIMALTSSSKDCCT